jgi:tRNA G10  N-methylase Trm11
MEYKYTPERENYEMYAAGGVFYSAPGHTAFPVRLASEIIRRCMAIRAGWGASGRAIIYDPCCGGAYHLATLTYLNWDRVERIYCSDMDDDALSVATRNLSLLSAAGLDRRMAEIVSLHQQFGKASHAATLQHALVLKQRLSEFSKDHQIEAKVFQADATDSHGIEAQLAEMKVDVVFTDIPYGQQSTWHSDTLALTQAADPVYQLLESLLHILAPTAVVAVAAAKKDKITHARYKRLEKISAGRRQIAILQPQFGT